MESKMLKLLIKSDCSSDILLTRHVVKNVQQK